MGADDGAFKEAQEALKVAPDYGPAYHIMAKIEEKRKDYKKAFECYRFGAMYTDDIQARVGLAQSYEHLKDY